MLTDRFSDALRFSETAHRDQRRKGTDIPYIAHLLSVAGLVLEHGGDEDQAIAALLHDAVEDQGGAEMARAIHDRFGDRVADIVLACTDADTIPKPPWRARKEAYLQALITKREDALLVVAADKLHNATAILEDHRLVGAAIWDRFNGGRDGTVWYYRELSAAIGKRFPGAISDRLARAVNELAEAARK